MLFRIVRPMKRPDSSNIWFRQRIPRDVIDKARGRSLSIPIGDAVVTFALTDRATEVKVSLRTRDPSEAKIRQAAVAAYLEGFWRSLRAGPQRLSHKQTIALAGELYRDWVGVFEDDPRSAELWQQVREAKAMMVCIDKATAVKMYDKVKAQWATYASELERDLDSASSEDRHVLEAQLDVMRTTDMAGVVSQGQNEIKELQDKGLDIRPHRKRMLDENLDERFKDADDPLRLVFVCAMWITGFDVPSCATIYLDKPIKNHNRGRNAEVDFRGQRRTNETHASTTDPDARLYRKSPGVGAALCFMGHALMENRNGLIVDAELTRATGTAERVAALAMIEGVARDGGRRVTLAADRAYDTADFVMEARELNATPHVAQNTAGRRSAIDGRTTRHKGYAASQRLRKRIEEFFGWAKAAAGLRKTKFRGLDRVRFAFTLTAAAYNLIRLPKLLAA